MRTDPGPGGNDTLFAAAYERGGEDRVPLNISKLPYSLGFSLEKASFSNSKLLYCHL